MGVGKMNQTPYHVESLGFGALVTPNTMDLMRRLILDSLKNYEVRNWAEKIIGYASNDFEKAEKIFNFVVNHSRYVLDPVNLEMLKSPIISLQTIEVGGSPALDCDDATILIGALVMSVGIPYALRAIGFNNEYSHVYGLIYIKDRGWVPADFVLAKRGKNLGDEASGVTRIKDLEVA